MIDFKLAQLRKKQNLTQQELGEILNVSYQTISKWETGTSTTLGKKRYTIDAALLLPRINALTSQELLTGGS